MNKYKIGDFVKTNSRLGLLVKEVVIDLTHGWICAKPDGYFFFERLDRIKELAFVSEEEKKLIYNNVNNCIYGGKYESYLIGIETDFFKITTRYEYNCQIVSEFIKNTNLEIGDSVIRSNEQERFHVIEIQQDAIILYLEDSEIIQRAIKLEYIVTVFKTDQDRKRKVLSQLQQLVYDGINKELVKNIKHFEFKIITFDDHVTNPLDYIIFDYSYYSFYIFNELIQSYKGFTIAFNKDSTIVINFRGDKIAGKWKEENGQIYIELINWTSKWEKSSEFSKFFVLRAYSNYQIRLWSYRCEGTGNAFIKRSQLLMWCPLSDYLYCQ